MVKSSSCGTTHSKHALPRQAPLPVTVGLPTICGTNTWGSRSHRRHTVRGRRRSQDYAACFCCARSRPASARFRPLPSDSSPDVCLSSAASHARQHVAVAESAAAWISRPLCPWFMLFVRPYCKDIFARRLTPTKHRHHSRRHRTGPCSFKCLPRSFEAAPARNPRANASERNRRAHGCSRAQTLTLVKGSRSSSSNATIAC